MMNVSWGAWICYARGLCLGDPLSLMLFLLVVEVLNALIRKVDSWSLLQPPGVNAIPYHTLVYADDLIMFIRLMALILT
jgi:hypothetical protein